MIKRYIIVEKTINFQRITTHKISGIISQITHHFEDRASKVISGTKKQSFRLEHSPNNEYTYTVQNKTYTPYTAHTQSKFAQYLTNVAVS